MRSKRRIGAERSRRFSPLLWLASFAAIAVLALGITGTLGQFVASITNTNNNAETGGPSDFGFSESRVVDGVPETPACAEASAGDSVNCDTINKNGEIGQTATPMAPGSVRNTTVRLANTAIATGLSGSLALNVQPCTQTVPVGDPNPNNGGTAAGDLCDTLRVTLACGGPSQPAFDVGPLTMTAFAAGTPYAVQAAIPPSGFVDCTFTTTYPTPGAADLQGLRTSQPMTWIWTQV